MLGNINSFDMTILYTWPTQLHIQTLILKVFTFGCHIYAILRKTYGTRGKFYVYQEDNECGSITIECKWNTNIPYKAIKNSRYSNFYIYIVTLGLSLLDCTTLQRCETLCFSYFLFKWFYWYVTINFLRCAKCL